VGLEAGESILPLPRPSFLGYQILQEYFTFPSKFLFFELSGLERLAGGGFGSSVELLFLVGSFAGAERQEALERGITKDTVRLGCTPVVNLFASESEPIRATHRSSEYLVRARGAAREFSPQIFSVDQVEAVVGASPKRVPLKPFFSFQHRDRERGSSVFWYSRRFPSSWLEDGATDVGLAFVDPDGEVLYPDFPTISAKLTCFNGSLPSRLPIGTDRDFQAEGGGGSALKRITSLLHPTEPIQPPLGSATFWRIVSQFSLNYLSLTEDAGEALREVLRLYDFGKRDTGERQVQGIAHVESEPWFARVRGEHGLAFARGRRVTVEFDEDLYSGGGIYLLATVLERFLGLYASVNSFSQLVARVRSRGRTSTLREWQPRAGTRPLL
jgi:type VI secretion system protein ImpG